MNYANIFRTAHNKARTVMALYGLSYRGAFAVCLSVEMKKAWALEKASKLEAANDSVNVEPMVAPLDEPKTGVFDNNDGTFTVLTYTRSWTYKTLRGAQRRWDSLQDEKQAALL